MADAKTATNRKMMMMKMPTTEPLLRIRRDQASENRLRLGLVKSSRSKIGVGETLAPAAIGIS